MRTKRIKVGLRKVRTAAALRRGQVKHSKKRKNSRKEDEVKGGCPSSKEAGTSERERCYQHVLHEAINAGNYSCACFFLTQLVLIARELEHRRRIQELVRLEDFHAADSLQKGFFKKSEEVMEITKQWISQTVDDRRREYPEVSDQRHLFDGSFHGRRRLSLGPG